MHMTTQNFDCLHSAGMPGSGKYQLHLVQAKGQYALAALCRRSLEGNAQVDALAANSHQTGSISNICIYVELNWSTSGSESIARMCYHKIWLILGSPYIFLNIMSNDATSYVARHTSSPI